MAAGPQIFVLGDSRAGLVGSHGVLTGRHGDEYAVAFGQPEVANGFFYADPPALAVTFQYLRNGVKTAAHHLYFEDFAAGSISLREL